ncbi:MAG TPA: serine/threonine-protein kinase [Steroidobacteraceae bacterium]|nr:serine/threonine-protein kinase [Steroidobacteraceae bacterium]
MTSPVAPGIRIADRYTLGEKLGSGGQGEVWMAFDEQELESVALKILMRTFAPGSDPWDVLQREYEVVCELDHPRILKTYPPLCAGDLAILPMKLATGGDLRQLRGAPYLEILPALIDLAHALEHAHAHGVVHRDLKPANVLFDGKGRVQLADFGVAGRTQEGIQIDQARTGWSPSSASPQQLTGLAPTPADDLYGLGALAFELLTGSPPYFPDFDVRRVLHEAIPAIEPVHVTPPSLLGLVRALLAKDPHHRGCSMGEVIIALTAALDDPPTLEYSNLGASARELAVPAIVTSEC